VYTAEGVGEREITNDGGLSYIIASRETSSDLTKIEILIVTFCNDVTTQFGNNDVPHKLLVR